MARVSGAARKRLVEKYGEEILQQCWLCGLECPDILQIAHLNQKNTDDRPSNLACLCPTCHRLYDVDMIPKKWIVKAGTEVRSGKRKYDVKALWKIIEKMTRDGKKANWDVLFKKAPSKGSQAALKAHRSRNSVSGKEKEIFDLAYQYVLDCGVGKAKIDFYLNDYKRASKTPKSLSDLFQELLKHGRNRNMVKNVIGDIKKLRKALKNFDPEYVEKKFKSPKQLLELLLKESIIPATTRKTDKSIWPRYCRTVLSCAEFINQFASVAEYQKHLDAIDKESNGDPVALPKYIQKEIYGFGFALACDFLKENGYPNLIKPDVHIKDIFVGIGYVKPKATDVDVFNGVIKFSEKIGEVPFRVDKLFFLIGRGSFYPIPPKYKSEEKIGSRKEVLVSRIKKSI